MPEGCLLQPKDPTAPKGRLLCQRGACCAQGVPAASKGHLLRQRGSQFIQIVGAQTMPRAQVPCLGTFATPKVPRSHRWVSMRVFLIFSEHRTPNTCLTASSSLNSVRCVRALSELSEHQALGFNVGVSFIPRTPNTYSTCSQFPEQCSLCSGTLYTQ